MIDRPQSREAVERITKHGGYVPYMRQEGVGANRIGLLSKNPDKGAAGPAHLGTEGR